jgi:hypothetical protein
MSTLSPVTVGWASELQSLYAKCQSVESTQEVSTLALVRSLLTALPCPLIEPRHIYPFYSQVQPRCPPRLRDLIDHLYSEMTKGLDLSAILACFTHPQVLIDLCQATRETLGQTARLSVSPGLNTDLMQAFAQLFSVVVVVWSEGSNRSFQPQTHEAPVLHLLRVSNFKFFLLEPSSPSAMLYQAPTMRGESDTLITLTCGHGVYRLATLEYLHQLTQGLLIPHEFECFPSVVCHSCNSHLQVNDILRLLGEQGYTVLAETDRRKAKYLYEQQQEINRRQGIYYCSVCNTPQQTDSMAFCVHFCNECLCTQYKLGLKDCSLCRIQIDDRVRSCLDYYCSRSCSLCRSTIPGLEISMISCADHYLCRDCAAKCTDQACTYCRRRLTEAEVKVVESLSPKCMYCKTALTDTLCPCKICTACHRRKCLESRRVMCSICRSDFTGPLREQLSAEIEKASSKERSAECPVCFQEFLRIDMMLLQCKHLVCLDCLANFISTGYFNSGAIECPTEGCKVSITYASICSKLPPEVTSKYDLQMANADTSHQLVDCPSCQNRYSISRQANDFYCDPCCKHFCIRCLKRPHPDIQDCNLAERELMLADLENQGVQLSQCPGCHVPYMKDDKCDHVTCKTPDCGVQFCFSCSCLRQPTLEHGNHYHRPDCRFFSDYRGAEDPKPDRCGECRKTPGKLCSRPAKLAVPRKFK